MERSHVRGRQLGLLLWAALSVGSFFQPWCSRLISEEELQGERLRFTRVIDKLSRMAAQLPHDEGIEARQQELLSRWEALLASLEAGDKVWISTEPPTHPEFMAGTVSLVIVRDGVLVHKIVLATA